MTSLRLSMFPLHEEPCPFCLQLAPSDHIVDCPMDALLRAHYHGWTATQLPFRCTTWCDCWATASHELILWGDAPFLLSVSGSPQYDNLPTYIAGRLGNLSPAHHDSFLHCGLQRVGLGRLLSDVALTTIFLRKRHTVPTLLLKGGYSPCSKAFPDIALAKRLRPTWYRVANWE